MSERINVENFRLPRYREIPVIGLYLEQTARYINGFLTPIGIGELTPSMISNYVKQGYIDNPVHKQYGASQMAKLFMVAVFKQVISMDNVGLLLSLQPETISLGEIYDAFCEAFEAELLKAFSLGREDVPQPREDEGWQLMRGVLVASANVIRLNNRFAEVRAAEGSGHA